MAMAKAEQVNPFPKLMPLMIKGKVNGVVAIILSKQYNKNERAESGKGLLHKAVEYGLKIDSQFKVLTALLLHGLNPLDESDDGTSPWDIACQNRSQLAQDILTPYIINPLGFLPLGCSAAHATQKLGSIPEATEGS